MKGNFVLKNLSAQLQKEYIDLADFRTIFFSTFKYILTPPFILSEVAKEHLAENQVEICTEQIDNLMNNQLVKSTQYVILITFNSCFEEIKKRIPNVREIFSKVYILKDSDFVKFPLKNDKESQSEFVAEMESENELIPIMLKRQKHRKNFIYTFKQAISFILLNDNNTFYRNKYHCYLWYCIGEINTSQAKIDLFSFLSRVIQSEHALQLDQFKQKVEQFENQVENHDITFLFAFPHIFSFINRMIKCFQNSQMLLHIRLILYYLKISVDSQKNSEQQVKRKWCWEKELIKEEITMLQEGNFIESLAIIEAFSFKEKRKQTQKYSFYFEQNESHLNYCFQKSFIKVSDDKIVILPSTIFKIKKINKNVVELAVISPKEINVKEISQADKIKINYYFFQENNKLIEFQGDIMCLEGNWNRAENYFCLIENSITKYLSFCLKQKLNFPLSFSLYSAKVQKYLRKIYFRLGKINYQLKKYKKADIYLSTAYESRVRNKVEEQNFYFFMNTFGLNCMQTQKFGKSTQIFNKCRMRAIKNQQFYNYGLSTIFLEELISLGPESYSSLAYLDQCISYLKEGLKKDEKEKSLSFIYLVMALKRNTILSNLADSPQNEIILKECRRIYSFVFGKQSEISIKTQIQLAKFYNLINQKKKAFNILQECQQHCQKCSLFDESYVSVLISLSIALRENNKHIQSLLLLKNTQRKVENVLNTLPKLQAQWKFHLAEAYQSLGMVNQAYNCYTESLNSIECEEEGIQKFPFLKRKINFLTFKMIEPVQIFCEQV